MEHIQLKTYHECGRWMIHLATMSNLVANSSDLNKKSDFFLFKSDFFDLNYSIKNKI